LNIDDIPNQLLIKYIIQKGKKQKIGFNVRGNKLDASNITLVWLRNFKTDLIDVGKNKISHRFAFQQWDHALRILQQNLKCKWINSPDATSKASDRMQQLSAAKALGFNIPATLITNDPESAISFYRSHNKDIVLKALHHHGIEIKNKTYSMYTHRIKKQDLSKLDDLVYAPCILQERLDKRSELRITVVGKQIFTVEIDSQSTHAGRDDWHRSSLRDLPRKVTKLEKTLSRRCIELIHSLGLVYGTIDLVIDKNGRPVFLEVNPIGDWLWLPREAGLSITEALVKMMARMLRA
jgi:glutathione synthase/RimK-type ligase-like ATP-grasp enzyme